MTVSRTDQALDGLTARELEGLRERIDRRLRACMACGADGAVRVRASAKLPPSGGEARMTLPLCPACIALHRLPEGRSET